MKNHFKLALFCVVILLVITLVWLAPEKENSRLVPDVPGSNTNNNSVGPSFDSLNLETGKIHSVPEAVFLAQGSSNIVQSSPQTRIEMVRQALGQKNIAINFYGKVVDQDNNSLSDVEIKVNVRHWELTDNDVSKVISIERKTDGSGRFKLDDATGDVFDIASIHKAGYELEPNTRSGFDVVGGRSDAPIVFKMWSTNIHESLISGERRFHLISDGRPYFINLSEGIIVDPNSGDLEVLVQYTNQFVRGQLYDWFAKIGVINGGLLEETNPYSSMFYAPTEGYVQEFQFKQQIKGGQHGSTGLHRFYVKLKNDQEYGRITINLHAPYNDQIPGLIDIQYAMNPSGSRILKP